MLILKEMILMKRNQKLARNLNVSIEYFNDCNFESINLLKKIKFDKMPVKTGLDSFIILKNNSIELYTNKYKRSNKFFIGYKDSILSHKTFLIKSLFNDESRTIRFKNYKLVKTFTMHDLYDLIFLIK